MAVQRGDDRNTAAIHHHHAPAAFLTVDERRTGERARALAVLERILGVGGEEAGVTHGVRGQVVALVAPVDAAERNLEHREYEQRQPEIAEEQPPGHSGIRSLKPTPRTVSIQPGSPSLRRSEATCTSIVRLRMPE